MRFHAGKGFIASALRLDAFLQKAMQMIHADIIMTATQNYSAIRENALYYTAKQMILVLAESAEWGYIAADPALTAIPEASASTQIRHLLEKEENPEITAIQTLTALVFAICKI